MPLEYRKWITREMLQEETNTLFVFGDNLQRKGLGGQAKFMRGEPNAVGIPTKKAPSNKEHAFSSDEDFREAIAEIDSAFCRLSTHMKSGGIVVWPEDGIGTGFAELPRRAPKIWQYLEKCRAQLRELSVESP